MLPVSVLRKLDSECPAWLLGSYDSGKVIELLRIPIFLICKKFILLCLPFCLYGACPISGGSLLSCGGRHIVTDLDHFLFQRLSTAA